MPTPDILRRLVLMAGLCTVSGALAGPTPSAQALLQRAWQAHGGEAGLATLRQHRIQGHGVRDLGALFQGQVPGAVEEVPVQEWLATWDDGSVAFEYRMKVNPDASEWLRMVYPPGGGLLLADRINQRAFWVPADEDAELAFLRPQPNLLVQELRQLDASAVTTGAQAGTLQARLPGGDTLRIRMDPKSGQVSEVSQALDVPMLGPTRLRWFYRYPSTGAHHPSHYEIWLGARRVQSVALSLARRPATPTSDLPGITVPPAPEPAAPNNHVAQEAGPPPPAEVRPLGNGLFLVPHVRGGFHALVVELDEGLLVVDAPAGYHEVRSLPAVDWAEAPDSGAIGRRLLDAAHRAVPGKPVRYLLLSHHHGDHLGGVDAFIEAGVHLFASPETADALANRPAGLPRPAAQQLTRVSSELRIGQGQRQVHALPAPGNPHADGMLVAWMPWARALYQSDLFFPSSQQFPDRSRLEVMRWFVAWLDRSGIAPETIYSIHGAARATPGQLDAIRAMPPDEPSP